MDVSFEAFSELDFRVGTILEVNDFPEAQKPAYQLTIDFGVLGIKKSSAQITTQYKKGVLVGKQILALVNIPSRKIAGFKSECLVLGATHEAGVLLLTPEVQILNGCAVH